MRKILLVFITVLGLTASLYAQERTITGKVTDAKDGSTLPGVSVGIKGTSSGAITDIDGKYSITVPSDETVLVFTFVGYIQQEITVGAMSVVDLQLASDVKVLKDVVVTANAIEKEKRSLGYATTTLKNDDLVKGSERSFLNAMQGQAPGVFITGNPGPGASSRIVLRGGTSLTGNNQPLMVVNGVPIDNSFFTDRDNTLNNPIDVGNRANDINPEDIESVTILKGPAAAALYGARASNGAILITTKTGKGAMGKNKKMEINYNTALTFETPLKLPTFQNEYGQGGGGKPDLRENFSWGSKFDGQIRPWGKAVLIDGVLQQKVKPYSALPNNIRDFFDVGQTFTNNLSLGGGNEQSNYFFSLGDVTQKGITPTTKYKRTSLLVNGSTKLSNKVYASSTVNYIRNINNAPLGGQSDESAFNNIINTPRDISLTELRDLNDPFNTVDGYYGPYTINPWDALYNNFFKATVDRMMGNVQLGYKPLQWLDVSYRLGTDFYADKRKQGKAIRRPSSGSGNDKNQPGFYEERSYNVNELVGDLMISVNKDISDKFTINGLIGHNFRQRTYNEQISTVTSLVIPGLYTLENGAGTPNTTNMGVLTRLHGIYGELNIGFSKYLFLGITGRNDWSSTLPKGKNAFFYPSANLSFVFTDAFNIQSKWLTYGKIRGSIAQVGNDPSGFTDPYRLESYVERTVLDFGGQPQFETRFPFNGIPGFTKSNILGNLDLKPEITQSVDLGLDVNLLNDRVKVEATYYSNLSKNQIISFPIAPSSGYTSKGANVGAITNKGIELLVKVTPFDVPNGFKWEITYNYTRNRNLVKEILPGVVDQVAIPGAGASGINLVAKEGEPYGSFFGIATLKDEQGRTIVDPTNGYPLREAAPSILGNVQPDFLNGVTNTFGYKGISLTIRVDSKWGGKLYSRTRTMQEFVGTDPRTIYNDRQPFVIPNSVIRDGSGGYIENTTPISNYERYWTDGNTIRGQDQTLIDASYIKLREVSLSYTLPKKWLQKTPFGSIQVGVLGRNLWLWTPKENTYVDPEMSTFGNGNAQGFDYTSVPSSRSIGGNLRLTF